MPFHDLNIVYNNDHAALSNTLLFAKELGYNTVAVAIPITGEVPTKPPVVPISAITVPPEIRVITRLTLTISDATQNHRLASLNPTYDILAVRPTNEKTLQLCCSSLECDLISIDFSQRLSYPLRFTTVASALQRGVRFEICYSTGVVTGSDARRNLISGATQLIRATRGRGIVLSSEAKGALGLRAAADVMNLAQVWGLPQQRAKEAVCEEAGKLARLAGLKRTSYRGVVDVIDSGKTAQTKETEKALQADSAGQGDPLSTNKAFNKSEKAKQKNQATSNGIKRKASTHSSSQNAQQLSEQPVSKREMKRLAKKARIEGNAAANVSAGRSPIEFPIPHETILSRKSKS